MFRHLDFKVSLVKNVEILFRRRIRLVPLFILLSLAIAQGAQAETEWIKFTLPAEGISLLLPAEPKVEVITDPKNERLNHKKFSLLMHGYAFVVEHYPSIGITNSEKHFADFLKGMLAVSHATLVSEREITLQGYPGREFEVALTAKDGSNFRGRTRMYVVGKTAFHLSYIWREDMDPALVSKIGEKYFSSLTLIDK